jgi:mannose-6-phosphate isomerase-like protein (cupin superfamily)
MEDRYVIPCDRAKTGVLSGRTGTFRVLLEPQACGARHFSLLVNTMNAGIRGDAHKHEDSEHGWYILSGRGTLYIEDRPYRLEPGTAAYVPINVIHSLEADPDEDLTYVVVYAPPGPEQKLIENGEKAFVK